MASLLDELEEENQKNELFTGSNIDVTYPTGFPILDQQLGYIQEIKLKDGTKIDQIRLGVGGGTIVQLVGPSSSGKTAAAIQMAYNITEPYGDDSGIIVLDAEESTTEQRILDLTGISAEEYKSHWRKISKKGITFSFVLDQAKALAEKKEANKDRFTYNSGFKDVAGDDIIYYKPSVILIDSLMALVADEKQLDEIEGQTSAGRDAIARGKFMRNLLGLGKKYNIIFLIINHFGNQMSMNGMPVAKQLTFIPTGKNIPGGDKSLYYTSAIILFIPVNSKDEIKTEEVNGYNGVKVRSNVVKSRSGPGGCIAFLEFVQESGFDPILTLMSFAKEKNLISGRNPSSYFVANPEVKFDTRIFVKEINDRPDIVDSLFNTCRPELIKMTRRSISSDEKKMEMKRHARNAMRNMFGTTI